MSSGISYVEQSLPWSDDTKTYYDTDLRSLALSAKIDEAPGKRFHYNNYEQSNINQKHHLEQFVFRFRNSNKKYLKVKDVAEEQVNSLESQV
jgi:hypothetical protein